jgi:hypothetical protein
MLGKTANSTSMAWKFLGNNGEAGGAKIAGKSRIFRNLKNGQPPKKASGC